MKNNVLILGIAITALFTSCGIHENVIVKTERGDTVSAYFTHAMHSTMAPGQKVTLYTTRFENYIVSNNTVITGFSLFDGHTVYTLQGTILKVN